MTKTHDLHAGNLFNVSGWVCVVTGGGSGIGLMAAQALAANGARVYITGRRQEVLEAAAKYHCPGGNEGAGRIIAATTCDTTKKEDIQRLVDDISSREERVDLLVASAGIAGPRAEPSSEDAYELRDTLWQGESFKQWSDVMQTNITSVYFTTVAFLPLLQESSIFRGDMTASVITISSISGIMRNSQGHFSYNAAKGGTVHLSKLMSKEFQKAQIRVNSIAPGYFPSEMTAKCSSTNGKNELPIEYIKKKGHVPAGRAGTDADMAQAILFLARNNYVNGEILAVDGGVLNEIAGR